MIRAALAAGSNENANGLVRQYLPRTVDLRRFTQADLDRIAAELDGRPLLILGFRTPSEVFAEALRWSPETAAIIRSRFSGVGVPVAAADGAALAVASAARSMPHQFVDHPDGVPSSSSHVAWVWARVVTAMQVQMF